ncbi:MAG: hypothetical protein K0S76_418 [Herbinix sp.]|jgi:RsiW-degrading membrane proteinase PrsW (M82 family)|nr:hypothetical protein [Herbinix sp.]
MEQQNKKISRTFILINVLMGIIVLAMGVLSIITPSDPIKTKLLIRVLLRGMISLLTLYNSIYLLFTKKYTPLAKDVSTKQRYFAGILLGIVGLIMLLTAFLGYGINGDPRLIWWE